jgi:hypothetical protein
MYIIKSPVFDSIGLKALKGRILLILHLIGLNWINYSFDCQQPFLLLRDEVTLKNITITVNMKAPGADFRGLSYK